MDTMNPCKDAMWHGCHGCQYIIKPDIIQINWNFLDRIKNPVYAKREIMHFMVVFCNTSTQNKGGERGTAYVLKGLVRTHVFKTTKKKGDGA
jgi:hypothetical protein